MIILFDSRENYDPLDLNKSLKNKINNDLFRIIVFDMDEESHEYFKSLNLFEGILYFLKRKIFKTNDYQIMTEIPISENRKKFYTSNFYNIKLKDLIKEIDEEVHNYY